MEKLEDDCRLSESAMTRRREQEKLEAGSGVSQSVEVVAGFLALCESDRDVVVVVLRQLGVEALVQVLMEIEMSEF